MAMSTQLARLVLSMPEVSTELLSELLAHPDESIRHSAAGRPEMTDELRVTAALVETSPSVMNELLFEGLDTFYSEKLARECGPGLLDACHEQLPWPDSAAWKILGTKLTDATWWEEARTAALTRILYAADPSLEEQLDASAFADHVFRGEFDSVLNHNLVKAASGWGGGLEELRRRVWSHPDPARAGAVAHHVVGAAVRAVRMPWTPLEWGQLSLVAEGVDRDAALDPWRSEIVGTTSWYAGFVTNPDLLDKLEPGIINQYYHKLAANIDEALRCADVGGHERAWEWLCSRIIDGSIASNAAVLSSPCSERWPEKVPASIIHSVICDKGSRWWGAGSSPAMTWLAEQVLTRSAGSQTYQSSLMSSLMLLAETHKGTIGDCLNTAFEVTGPAPARHTSPASTVENSPRFQM